MPGDLGESVNVEGLHAVGRFVSSDWTVLRVEAVFAVPATLTAVQESLRFPGTSIDGAGDPVRVLLLEVVDAPECVLPLDSARVFDQGIFVGRNGRPLSYPPVHRHWSLQHLRYWFIFVEVFVGQVVSVALHSLEQVAVAEFPHLLSQTGLVVLLNLVMVHRGCPIVQRSLNHLVITT